MDFQPLFRSRKRRKCTHHEDRKDEPEPLFPGSSSLLTTTLTTTTASTRQPIWYERYQYCDRFRFQKLCLIHSMEIFISDVLEIILEYDIPRSTFLSPYLDLIEDAINSSMSDYLSDSLGVSLPLHLSLFWLVQLNNLPLPGEALPNKNKESVDKLVEKLEYEYHLYWKKETRFLEVHFNKIFSMTTLKTKIKKDITKILMDLLIHNQDGIAYQDELSVFMPIHAVQKKKLD